MVPCSLYAVLALTALFLRTTTQLALFVIGAAALGLLLVGIHNAWDTVTHVLVGSSPAMRRRPSDTREAKLDVKSSGSQPSGKGLGEYFIGTARNPSIVCSKQPIRHAWSPRDFWLDAHVSPKRCPWMRREFDAGGRASFRRGCSRPRRSFRTRQPPLWRCATGRLACAG